MNDRRKTDPNQAQASDRLTKQMIVFSVCGVGVLFAWTECWQSLSSSHVVPEINQMATLVLGALIGWLGKTSVDFQPPQHQVEITNTPENPVPTESAGDADGKDGGA